MARFYVAARVVSMSARLASRFSIPCRRLSGPTRMVASAKLSQLLEESETQITGIREPEARIRNVSLSLLSAGMEWLKRTRSKSPLWNWAIPSRMESADVMWYPADCQTDR